MPNLLVLVRHGESVWNADHRLQGQLDPRLSELGRAQARALTPVIARVGLPDGRVVCSDLSRARETAALLGLSPGRLDPAWREIDVGEWGGRTAAEVDAEGTDVTNWRAGPRTGPGGETWAAFSDRIAAAVDGLVAASGSWLVVCHGGCVRAACAHLLTVDPLALGAPPNASATTLELGRHPRLLTYGLTAGAELPTGLY